MQSGPPQYMQWTRPLDLTHAIDLLYVDEIALRTTFYINYI